MKKILLFSLIILGLLVLQGCDDSKCSQTPTLWVEVAGAINENEAINFVPPSGMVIAKPYAKFSKEDDERTDKVQQMATLKESGFKISIQIDFTKFDKNDCKFFIIDWKPIPLQKPVDSITQNKKMGSPGTSDKSKEISESKEKKKDSQKLTSSSDESIEVVDPDSLVQDSSCVLCQEERLQLIDKLNTAEGDKADLKEAADKLQNGLSDKEKQITLLANKYDSLKRNSIPKPIYLDLSAQDLDKYFNDTDDKKVIQFKKPNDDPDNVPDVIAYTSKPVPRVDFPQKSRKEPIGTVTIRTSKTFKSKKQ